MTVPDAASDVVQPTPSFVQSFFRHGATYAVAGMLSQGIGLLLFPLLAHVLAPRDYGIIDLVALVTTLVNLTIALEISQGLGRNFADATSEDERRAYASTAFLFTLAVYTTALAIALVFIRRLTDLVLGDDVRTSVMAVALVAMWCSGMLYLMQDLLRWQLRPKAFALVSILTAGITAATTATLVLGFDSGVIGALVGQLAGFGTAALVAYAFSARLFRLRFDRGKFIRMLSYSIPLIPASVGVFLNGYADRLAIRSRLTLADVGLYGVGYRLSFIVSLTLLGFQAALLPLVLSHHELPQTRRDLARIFRLFCALALLVSLGVSLFADELLRILTRPTFYPAAQVVPLLVAASFLGGMYIFAPGLSVARRTGPYLAVVMTCGLANAALAFGLARPLGIRGPALAFLLTAGLAFTALMILSQRAYHVPHAWGDILLTGGAVASATVVGRSFLGGDVTPLRVVVKVALVGGCIVLIGARLLTREERVGLARLPRQSARALHSALRRAHARPNSRRV